MSPKEAYMSMSKLATSGHFYIHEMFSYAGNYVFVTGSSKNLNPTSIAAWYRMNSKNGKVYQLSPADPDINTVALMQARANNQIDLSSFE